ncbi:MAG TPA: hypothetical protein VG738_15335 [Chitinophagaceae bacterium]|nr:hypothetical protein [Chitinophagaceae bacterium]
MNMPVAVVKSAFKVTGFGMIFFLKHQQVGLRPGTILISKISGLKWKVKCRVLAVHAFEIQKIFEGEDKVFAHYLLGEVTLEEARLKIVKEEEQHIYQYIIEPFSHQDKPGENEELVIEEA